MRTLITLVVMSSSAFAQEWIVGPQRGPAASAGRGMRSDVGPSGGFTVGLEVDSTLARGLDQDDLTGTERDPAGVPQGTLNPNVSTDGTDLSSTAFWVRGAYSIYAPPGSPFGIEAYVLLGMADLTLDGDVDRTGQPSQDFDVDGDSSFAFGLGVRARVYRADRFNVMADLSTRRSEHDAEIAMVSHLDLDLNAGETAEQDFTAVVLTHRFAVYGSYAFDAGGSVTILPYGGFRLSWIKLDLDGKQSVFDPGFDKTQSIEYSASQEGVFDVFLGVEALFAESASAFFEFRFVDDTGFTLGASWTF